jgi:hypothetical protein
MVTGHKDWRMLRRYTNLKPEDLHKLQKASQPSMEEFIETLASRTLQLIWRVRNSVGRLGPRGAVVLWKLPLSGHRAHGLTCCRLDPVANDPERASERA